MKVGWGFWALLGGLAVTHFFLHVGLGLGAAPDLLTVAVLLGAREMGVGSAAGLGLALGLLEDSLSVLSFGANALAMTLVGVAGAATRDLFVGDSRLFVITYFLFGKWLRDLIHWIAVGDVFRQPFVDQVLIGGFLGGMYAALVGLALFELGGLRTEASG
jgi:cell shape-determining protein MreD